MTFTERPFQSPASPYAETQDVAAGGVSTGGMRVATPIRLTISSEGTTSDAITWPNVSAVVVGVEVSVSPVGASLIGGNLQIQAQAAGSSALGFADGLQPLAPLIHWGGGGPPEHISALPAGANLLTVDTAGATARLSVLYTSAASPQVDDIEVVFWVQMLAAKPTC